MGGEAVIEIDLKAVKTSTNTHKAIETADILIPKALKPGALKPSAAPARNDISLPPSQELNLIVPDEDTVAAQLNVWNYLLDYYFRSEVTGWEKIPSQPSMLVGIHSGTWLTMDAWVLCFEWGRRFKTTRYMHGTAHDVLMMLPGLGDYFRKLGVISANRHAVSAAFAQGHDVAIWPGGEVDAMRAWSKRDKVVLGGRKGFIRQAIRSGVPIVPVATVGGHDTVFVLSECRSLAKMLRLKKLLRSDVLPLTLGFPFGITFEVLPMHIPLPAKIRTEILDPIEIDNDPERENDAEYVDRIYCQVETAIQAGVDRLARKRKFPIFG